MFRTVPLSIIRSFSLYTEQWFMSYRFADSLRAGSGRNWFPAGKLSTNLYDILVYHCCVCIKELLMMDRGTVRNMQFYSRNIFEKLVYLVGFIIRTHTHTHTHTHTYIYIYVFYISHIYIYTHEIYIFHLLSIFSTVCVYCCFYFRCRTAGQKSVFGRSCDRPPRHRFFSVSLCL